MNEEQKTKRRQNCNIVQYTALGIGIVFLLLSVCIILLKKDQDPRMFEPIFTSCVISFMLIGVTSIFVFYKIYTNDQCKIETMTQYETQTDTQKTIDLVLNIVGAVFILLSAVVLVYLSNKKDYCEETWSNILVLMSPFGMYIGYLMIIFANKNKIK